MICLPGICHVLVLVPNLLISFIDFLTFSLSVHLLTIYALSVPKQDSKSLAEASTIGTDPASCAKHSRFSYLDILAAA